MAEIGDPTRRRALALLLGLALFAPAAAQGADEKTTLDHLFAQLAEAPDERTARSIANRIWSLWTAPADPALAAPMALIITARTEYEFDVALDLLDKLISAHPDYAEAWNQRATIRYLTQDIEGALADIDRTLALEPRHFGALAGRALIRLSQDRRDLALRDMMRALQLHPFLPERSLFPELGKSMTRV